MNGSSDSHLAGLNARQARAVKTHHGPLLVLAGAGTGKTRVITCRIAHLISNGVLPSEILALTFTKRAADEMATRVGELLPDTRVRPTVCTFHSLGFRILRKIRNHTQAGVEIQVATRETQLDIVARVQFKARHRIHAEGLLVLIAKAKSEGISQEEIQSSISNETDRQLSLVYKAYDAEMAKRNLIDMEDMVFMSNRILNSSSQYVERFRSQWHYFLVDEYQDTNNMQFQLLKTLLGSRTEICVVGDDDQSIYGFRGANIEIIRSFQNDFPGGERICLESNYRCHSEIVEFANRVIQQASFRYDKVLRSELGRKAKVVWRTLLSETSELEFVSSAVVKVIRSGYKASDIAILCRTDKGCWEFKRAVQVEGIQILTIHRSKGLEFPVVFLPGLEEGLLPHWNAVSTNDDSAIQEELRLFYVGITRAKKHLVISNAENRDSHSQKASRFLNQFRNSDSWFLQKM